MPPYGENMNHTNKVSEATDPTPNQWFDYHYEDKPKDTGNVRDGLSMRKPLFNKFESPGGREDATTRS